VVSLLEVACGAMTIVVDRLSARRLPEHLSLVSHEGDLPRMCRLWLDVRADGVLLLLRSPRSASCSRSTCGFTTWR
jgi:hypothetical protein